MKSGDKYEGELTEPIKNFRYFFNLLMNKFNYFYVKYIYNFNNKKDLIP